jgi:hypothetical protein
MRFLLPWAQPGSRRKHPLRVCNTRPPKGRKLIGSAPGTGRGTPAPGLESVVDGIALRMAAAGIERGTCRRYSERGHAII